MNKTIRGVGVILGLVWALWICAPRRGRRSIVGWISGGVRYAQTTGYRLGSRRDPVGRLTHVFRLKPRLQRGAALGPSAAVWDSCGIWWERATHPFRLKPRLQRCIGFVGMRFGESGDVQSPPFLVPLEMKIILWR